MPALLFILVFVHTLLGSPQSHLVHQPARPACCPFGRPGSTHKRLYTHPFPAAAERKLLLNFFSKKLRESRGQRPLAYPAQSSISRSVSALARMGGAAFSEVTAIKDRRCHGPEIGHHIWYFKNVFKEAVRQHARHSGKKRRRKYTCAVIC